LAPETVFLSLVGFPGFPIFFFPFPGMPRRWVFFRFGSFPLWDGGAPWTANSVRFRGFPFFSGVGGFQVFLSLPVQTLFFSMGALFVFGVGGCVCLRVFAHHVFPPPLPLVFPVPFFFLRGGSVFPTPTTHPPQSGGNFFFGRGGGHVLCSLNFRFPF